MKNAKTATTTTAAPQRPAFFALVRGRRNVVMTSESAASLRRYADGCREPSAYRVVVCHVQGLVDVCILAGAQRGRDAEDVSRWQEEMRWSFMF